MAMVQICQSCSPEEYRGSRTGSTEFGIRAATPLASVGRLYRPSWRCRGLGEGRGPSGQRSIGEVVVVRPSSGFGAPNSSLVLNSFTVSRSVAVALAREDAAGKSDGTFQGWASIPRGGAGQGWRADRSRAAGSGAREQVDIRFQPSDLGLADPG